MNLTPQQVTTFYQQGYFILPQLFSLQEVEEMKVAAERLERTSDFLSSASEQIVQGSKFVFSWSNKQRYLKRVVWCGAAEPVLLNYGQDGRLITVAAELLGSTSIDHLINQIHFKLPHDGILYPFHQDSTHRRYGTPEWNDANGKGSYVQTVTALDEVTLENGPLLLIPESCKQGHLHLPYQEQEETISPLFNSKDAVPALMQPGDTVFFGPYTIHGSTPNTSDKPRRVFINGFAYPEANKKEYVGAGKGVRIKV